MATYAISDIHGSYEGYIRMLDKIEFSDTDMLYVLGDVVDAGEHPITVLLDLMERPNVCCLAGNHEVMFLECMQFLLREVTEKNISDFGKEEMEKLVDWQQHRCDPTIREFRALGEQTRKLVLDFVSDFELYEEVETAAGSFILVHAGLDHFDPKRELWDYTLDELVWGRPDYGKAYFPDRYVVAGHTPTLFIEENPRKGFIYRANNHFAIDCGCGIEGGRLGCLRLDDLKEFYVEV